MDLTLNFILLVLGVLIIAGRALSQATGKSPSNLIDNGKLSSAVQSNNGLWWFMLPILLLFTTAFNLLLYAFWFVQAAFDRIAVWIVWIYREVIVSGFFFLFRILWHYLVVCPWTVLSAGFMNMGPAFRKSSFLTAVTGLSVALFLSFIGRFVSSLAGLSEGNGLMSNAIPYIFHLLAILPIGMACTVIASRKENGTGTSTPGIGLNYLTNAILLLLALPILLALQVLLLWLGTLSDFRFVLTTLLAGGTMIGGFLLLFNATLTLFILLALPGFTLTYTGKPLSIYTSFFRYLHRKWLRYALVIPAIVIPALLLVALPYFITSGVGQMVKVSTRSVVERAINSQKETVSSYPTPNYIGWRDPNSVDDDSLKKAFESDLLREEAVIGLDQLNYMNDYLVRAYHGHAHRNGTIPFIGLVGLLGEYDSVHTAKHLHALLPTSIKDENAKRNKVEASSNMQEIEAKIVSSQNRIQGLERELELVCATFEPRNPEEQAPPRDETVSPERETDYCEVRRSELREEIGNEKKSLATLNERLQRADTILSHFNQVKSLYVDKFNLHNITLMIGYLLLGIWFSILLGFAFGMGLSLFAHLTHAVHKVDDESDWMLTVTSRELHDNNPRQPLLGIALLLACLSILSFSNPFGLSTTLNKTYNSAGLWASSLKDHVKETLDIVRTSFAKRSLFPFLDSILPGSSTEKTRESKMENVNTLNPIESLPTPPAAAELPAEALPDIQDVGSLGDTISVSPPSEPSVSPLPRRNSSGEEVFPNFPIEEPGTFPDEGQPEVPSDSDGGG